MGIHLFFPVSNLVEHRLFSSLSLRGMMELYLTAALGPQSAKKKKDNAVEFSHFERFKVTPAGGQGLLSAPSTVNESHWTSKAAINKQTLARPLIANDRLFVSRFPSGSKCSYVKAGSISRRVAVR